MKNSGSLSKHLNKVFIISTVVTVLWMIMMGLAIKPLNSKQIVSFELAKTPVVASGIIDGWKEKGLLSHAKKSIYLDFVFLLLYSTSIGLGCVLLSKFTHNAILIKSGLIVSKIVPLAGVCDVIEDLAMLKTLSGEIVALPVTIAYWFAVIKFILILLSLLFIISCGLFGIAKKIVTK